MDRIENLKITKENIKIPDDFNLEEYTAKCWKMFFGELINIELKFENSLLPLVKDKFKPKYYEIINRNEKGSRYHEPACSSQFFEREFKDEGLSEEMKRLRKDITEKKCWHKPHLC